jgi:hypothetical protein
MKNLFNDIDSSEKSRILEMHKKQGYGTIVLESPMDSMFYQGDDYVKDMGKNMFSQDDNDEGKRENFDYKTFKTEVSIMAPGSSISLDKDNNVININVRKSKWYSKKNLKRLLKNYSDFLEQIPSDVNWLPKDNDVENMKFKINSKN